MITWAKLVLALIQLAAGVATWARENELLKQGEQDAIAEAISKWLGDLREADAARDAVRQQSKSGGVLDDGFDRDSPAGPKSS